MIGAQFSGNFSLAAQVFERFPLLLHCIRHRIINNGPKQRTKNEKERKRKREKRLKQNYEKREEEEKNQPRDIVKEMLMIMCRGRLQITSAKNEKTK